MRHVMNSDCGTTVQTIRSENDPDADHDRTVLRWVFPEPKTVVLDGTTELFIGRDESCDVRLPSPQISRRHAEIGRAGPVWFVNDLSSKNGVYLNGVRVRQSALALGDVLRIGDFVAVVHRLGAGCSAECVDLGGGLFGGPVLQQLSERAQSAARSDLSIVLQGETGTGKERFARAIHEWSFRSGPFLGVNCAGYTEAIAAGELFGYRKGAFTGAERASAGHIRAAEGGTLFLDEVIDLPLPVQATLLRALEQREVMPLGETRCVPIDVRFVAAAQIPLAQAVAEGRFRADLQARLEGVVLPLPPLRERREDVCPLFVELLARHATGWPPSVEARVIEKLCLYPWPLNVRELDLLVRRLLVLFPSETKLGPQHLAEALPALAAVRHDTAPPLTASSTGRRRREAAVYAPEEVEAVLGAMTRHSGNITRAAAELNISRQKAYRMLEYARASKGE
jgi:DNA-binding NtrC family response regulator